MRKGRDPAVPRPPGPGRRRRWGKRAPWAALLLVAAVALAVGAGVGGREKPASLYQRTLQVAGQYRCPVCAGESVAASGAPEAVQIRRLVQGWLAEGRSGSQIRSDLLADYGPSILESPPASGVDILVWVLPLIAVLLAAGGLALSFARWRRAPLMPQRAAEASSAPDGPSALQPSPKPGPQRRLSRSDGHIGIWRPLQRASLYAGVALMLVAGALFLLDRASSARLSGEAITGGPTGVGTALQQASLLAAKDPAGALRIYDEVIASNPHQPVALTAEGWIYVEAGFVTKGMGMLAQAEKADPGYDLPHLYQGLVLLDDEGEPAAAASQFEWYLSHGPQPGTSATAKAGLELARAEA